jgi:hypothetical protein
MLKVEEADFEVKWVEETKELHFVQFLLMWDSQTQLKYHSLELPVCSDIESQTLYDSLSID